MTDAGVHFEWLEFNGMHAFMRDEGYRYDPQLEMFTMQYAISMFQRKLHQGDTGMNTCNLCTFLQYKCLQF
jgi:hypothetical protein